MNAHQYLSEIYFKEQHEEILSALSGALFELISLLRDICICICISCTLCSALRWFRCCWVFCSASYNLYLFYSVSALYRAVASLRPSVLLAAAAAAAAAFLPYVGQSTAFLQTPPPPPTPRRSNSRLSTDPFPPKHSSSSFGVCENHLFLLCGQLTLFCSGIFCRKWKQTFALLITV